MRTAIFGGQRAAIFLANGQMVLCWEVFKGWKCVSFPNSTWKASAFGSKKNSRSACLSFRNMSCKPVCSLSNIDTNSHPDKLIGIGSLQTTRDSSNRTVDTPGISIKMYAVVHLMNNKDMYRFGPILIVSSVWFETPTKVLLPPQWEIWSVSDLNSIFLKNHINPSKYWTAYKVTEIFRHDNLRDAEYMQKQLMMGRSFPYQMERERLKDVSARTVAKSLMLRGVRTNQEMLLMRNELKQIINHLFRHSLLRELSELGASALLMSSCIHTGMDNISLKFSGGETVKDLSEDSEMKQLTSISLENCSHHYSMDIVFLKKMCPSLTKLELNDNIYSPLAFKIIAEMNLTYLSFGARRRDVYPCLDALLGVKSQCKTTLETLTITTDELINGLKDYVKVMFPKLMCFDYKKFSDFLMKLTN